MTAPPPTVTVVVPTYERPAALARCLAALARLEYPRDRFELIVVDDGGRSPDATAAATRRDDLAMRLLRLANAGPAAARNLALSHARGEMLAFTDDDCAPEAGWLRALAGAWLREPSALVGGRTVNALPDNEYAATSQLILDTAYEHFLPRSSGLRFFASNNLAVGAALLREAGGFDPAFRTSEDRDLSCRWLAAGRPLVYAADAVVAHHHELDALGFWRQHFGYGRGAHLFRQARRARGGAPSPPDLRFYAAVARRALRQAPRREATRRLTLLLLWQAANLAGFVRQALAPAPSLAAAAGRSTDAAAASD